MPAGRPSKYDPHFCEMIIDYFESAASAPIRELAPVITDTTGGKSGNTQKTEVRHICAELPTIEGFGRSIGVSRQTMINWARDNEEFLEACARVKDIQYALLVDRGLTRQYDPTAFLFVAKNVTWMRDRQEISGPDGGSIDFAVSPSRESLEDRIAGIAARIGTGGTPQITDGN